MENNNGKGIFYGVIGVATLVVAIIGATFAFFSATATNNETITGNTAASAEMKLVVTRETGEATADKMIPMLNADLQKGVTGVGNSCIDNNGNTVCQVYKIVVTNASSAGVVVKGTLNLAHGGATNMKWQLIENATTVGDVGTVVNSGAETPFASNVSLAASASETYYVAVWLSETGTAQDDPDAGRTFNGTVTFNAVDAQGNTSGITASFAA